MFDDYEARFNRWKTLIKQYESLCYFGAAIVQNQFTSTQEVRDYKQKLLEIKKEIDVEFHYLLGITIQTVVIDDEQTRENS